MPKRGWLMRQLEDAADDYASWPEWMKRESAFGKPENPVDQKLFQITEDDLAALERIMPQFADALMDRLDGSLRVKLRRVQSILSNVRWNYGPPTDVERIDAGA